jgi:hypothetical protein
MHVPIVYGKEEKTKAVYDFLVDPTKNVLILAGLQGGGEGKTAATNEAVHRWMAAIGEENVKPLSICEGSGLGHNQAYMDLRTWTVKIIMHTNMWNEKWIDIGHEMGAQTYLFRRILE